MSELRDQSVNEGCRELQLMRITSIVPALIDEEQWNWIVVDDHQDSYSDDRVLGAQLLRHGKTIKKIHGYFRNLEARKCCMSLAGPKTSLTNIRLVRNDGRDSGIEEGAMSSSSLDPSSFTKQLGQKDFAVYQHAMLCAEFPVLGAPSPPPHTTPPPRSTTPMKKSQSGSQLSLKSNQSASTMRQNSQPDSDSDEATSPVHSETLFELVRQAFGLTPEKHQHYSDIIVEGHARKPPPKLLVEELVSQLVVLENNRHPYYSPQSFLSRNAYDQWQQMERGNVSQLINKFWHFSLPPPQSAMSKSAYWFNRHEEYNSLLKRLIRFESTFKRSSAFFIPLSSSSRRLLKEFGLRYGVGDLYRKAIYLEYLARNFENEVGLITHITKTVDRLFYLIQSQSQQRTRLIMTRSEFELVNQTVTLLHGQCGNSLTRIKRLFADNQPPDGVESLIYLLSSVLRLKSLVTGQKGRSVEHWLKQYLQESFAIAYERHKLIATTELNLNAFTTPLSPRLLNILLFDIRDEVTNYRQYYTEVFQPYCDIVQLAARAFYKFLMEDVKQLCDLAVQEDETGEIDLMMLSLSYRLNRLDADWAMYILPEDQTWRKCFLKQISSWLVVLKEHMVSLVLQSTGSDKFETLVLPSELEDCPLTSSTQEYGRFGPTGIVLNPSESSAFSSVSSSGNMTPRSPMATDKGFQGRQSREKFGSTSSSRSVGDFTSPPVTNHRGDLTQPTNQRGFTSHVTTTAAIHCHGNGVETTSRQFSAIDSGPFTINEEYKYSSTRIPTVQTIPEGYQTSEDEQILSFSHEAPKMSNKTETQVTEKVDTSCIKQDSDSIGYASESADSVLSHKEAGSKVSNDTPRVKVESGVETQKTTTEDDTESDGVDEIAKRTSDTHNVVKEYNSSDENNRNLNEEKNETCSVTDKVESESGDRQGQIGNSVGTVDGEIAMPQRNETMDVHVEDKETITSGVDGGNAGNKSLSTEVDCNEHMEDLQGVKGEASSEITDEENTNSRNKTGHGDENTILVDELVNQEKIGESTHDDVFEDMGMSPDVMEGERSDGASSNNNNNRHGDDAGGDRVMRVEVTEKEDDAISQEKKTSTSSCDHVTESHKHSDNQSKTRNVLCSESSGNAGDDINDELAAISAYADNDENPGKATLSPVQQERESASASVTKYNMEHMESMENVFPGQPEDLPPPPSIIDAVFQIEPHESLQSSLALSDASSVDDNSEKVLPISGSLIDVISIVKRLSSFLATMYDMLSPIHECSDACVANGAESDIHRVAMETIYKQKLKAGQEFYDRMLQAFSSTLCNYADNMLGMDLCAVPKKIAIKLLGRQLLQHMRWERKSNRLWGCRHMADGIGDCYQYVSRESQYLCDSFEPVTQDMCTRINNVAGLIDLIPVFKGILSQAVPLYNSGINYQEPQDKNTCTYDFVMIGDASTIPKSISDCFSSVDSTASTSRPSSRPSSRHSSRPSSRPSSRHSSTNTTASKVDVTNITPVRHKSGDTQTSEEESNQKPYQEKEPLKGIVFGHCELHLNYVKDSLINLLAQKMNLFFKQGLQLLIELDMEGYSIEKRLQPLTVFLTNYLKALKQWLYPECYSRVHLVLWYFITEDFEEEAYKLKRFQERAETKAMLLLQALSFMIEFIHDGEQGLSIDQLIPPAEHVMQLLQLFSWSTKKLINLHQRLHSQKSEEGDALISNLQLPPRELLQKMRHDLHNIRKCFTGKQIVEWIMVNYPTKELPTRDYHVDDQCIEVEIAMSLAQRLLGLNIICATLEDVHPTASTSRTRVSTGETSSVSSPYPEISLHSRSHMITRHRWSSSDSESSTATGRGPMSTLDLDITLIKETDQEGLPEGSQGEEGDTSKLPNDVQIIVNEVSPLADQRKNVPNVSRDESGSLSTGTRHPEERNEHSHLVVPDLGCPGLSSEQGHLSVNEQEPVNVPGNDIVRGGSSGVSRMLNIVSQSERSDVKDPVQDSDMESRSPRPSAEMVTNDSQQRRPSAEIGSRRPSTDFGANTLSRSSTPLTLHSGASSTTSRQSFEAPVFMYSAAHLYRFTDVDDEELYSYHSDTTIYSANDYPIDTNGNNECHRIKVGMQNKSMDPMFVLTVIYTRKRRDPKAKRLMKHLPKELLSNLEGDKWSFGGCF